MDNVSRIIFANETLKFRLLALSSLLLGIFVALNLIVLFNFDGLFQVYGTLVLLIVNCAIVNFLFYGLNSQSTRYIVISYFYALTTGVMALFLVPLLFAFAYIDVLINFLIPSFSLDVHPFFRIFGFIVGFIVFFVYYVSNVKKFMLYIVEKELIAPRLKISIYEVEKIFNEFVKYSGIDKNAELEKHPGSYLSLLFYGFYEDELFNKDNSFVEEFRFDIVVDRGLFNQWNMTGCNNDIQQDIAHIKYFLNQVFGLCRIESHFDKSVVKSNPNRSFDTTIEKMEAIEGFEIYRSTYVKTT